MLPLENNIVGFSVVKELTSYAEGLADSFGAIGRGIGAVMLLIVVFYYISSILDGGKFQIKMLIPFLIFFFVCNFSWIATPVTAFTSTITSSLVASCNSVNGSIKEKYDCKKSATFNDMYNSMHQDEAGDAKQIIDDAYADFEKTKDEEEMAGNSSENGSKDDGDESKPKGLFGKMSFHVKKGIGEAATKSSLNMQKELSTAGLNIDDASEGGFKATTKNLGWLSPISAIISFICKIMSTVLTAFGGIMTAIIVAFGPITWAFAIFPGQGSTIKSWFIRLCQFSLWSPICALVDCFSVKIFDIFATSQGAGAIMMAIAVAVCNLIALTSVPTIASMIIEGAQGSVSLSQGLQTMGGALTVAGSMAKNSAYMVVGKDNKLSNSAAGLKQQGMMGFGRTVGEQYKADSASGVSNPFSGALKSAFKRNQAIGRKARR